MSKFKKRITLLFFIIIFIFVIFNKYIRFYTSISVELLKLNKELATVSSNFYSNPTDEISYKDIVYKKRGDLDLTLDIYSSKKEVEGGSPVILYVFGNCWMCGDKTIPSELIPLINILREQGFTIICTSYELLKSEAIFDKQVADIKDTVRWINKNKDIYNFDIDNIGIIAPSAGAQLSMLAAYSDNNLFCDDEDLAKYPSKINYVIDLFGPSELNKVNISAAPKEIVSKLNDYNMDEISELYSPINYVKEDLPDTLIIHSEIDNIVPYNTSLELYNKAINFNNNFKFISLKSCTHYLENLSISESVILYFNILNYIFLKSF